MKFKKTLISNMDVVQVANFTSVSSVTQTPQTDSKSDISEQDQITLTNNVVAVVSDAVKNTSNINQLIQTKNTKQNKKVKQEFLTNITNKLDIRIKSNPLKEQEVKSRLNSYDFLANYNVQLRNVKKEIDNQKQTKVLEKAPDRILTPYNTYINNDPWTSKVLSLLLEKYQKIYKIKRELYEQLAKEQKFNTEIQNLIVVFTAASVVTGFFGLFIAPLAFVAAGAGLIALGLSVYKEFRKTKTNAIKRQLELLDQIEEIDLTKFIKDGVKWGVDFAANLSDLAIQSLATDIAIKNASKYISKVWGIFSVAYDVHSFLKSSDELDEEINKLKAINIEIEQIREMKLQYAQQWDNFKKLNKIVVISETPQTFAYKSGGTGGTNMFFKRLIDGKIFSRKEMLAMSKYELDSYNLTKVKRTVTKNNQTYTYEYIRSKNSNKLLEDNLG